MPQFAVLILLAWVIGLGGVGTVVFSRHTVAVIALLEGEGAVWVAETLGSATAIPEKVDKKPDTSDHLK